jgi:hypothetical protein
MHVTFSDIVNEVLKGDWGRDYANKADAARNILDNDKQTLAAIATLELLRRFDAIGRAAGQRQEEHNYAITMPKDAKAFPHKSVGDMLYEGDLEDSVREYVIIAKDSEHHCMIVQMNNFCLRFPPSVSIATDYYSDSIADAVKREAARSLAYHHGRAVNAQAALDAATKGEDLSAFIDGYSEAEPS